MADLFSKISEILSNPESAQKIREIASSISAGDSGSAESSSDLSSAVPALAPSDGDGFDVLGVLGGLSSSGGTHSRDLALLNAMRPYLRASRAGKIDNVIKAIRMIDMLSALR